MKRASGPFAAALSLFCLIPGIYAQRDLAGSAAAQLAIERLSVNGRALMIAAHPDDENTALLAWLARGRKVRTGYLSITRGEGGQNLIGPEQGSLLGVIRTQELLAARRIDGAEQYFTSAVDFGFSKSVDETLAKWGREKTLGEMVRVIREFRPHVIILRFSGTPRDGHGHHQASAVLGREAFTAAADPTRFPEQLKDVQPWQATRLLWNVFSFTREQELEAAKLSDRLEVDLGAYDPLLGYSYSEIAGMSRSEHRSQGMGSPERRGSAKNYLAHVAGTPAKADLFEGTAPDTPLNIPFDPRKAHESIPYLLEARKNIAKDRREEVGEAIALCAGLWLDASAAKPYAVAGSEVPLTKLAVNRSPVKIEWEGTPLTYNKVETRKSAVSSPQAIDFNLTVLGQPLVLKRPVHYRYVDKIRGELTRPFEVGPPVSVRIAEPTLVFASREARKIDVQLLAFAPAQSGSVRLRVPAGWRAEPESQAFALTAVGQQSTVTFNVTPPVGAAEAELSAVAAVNGKDLSTHVLVIDYPHIPPQTLFEPAAAKAVRADVNVLARNVGYIMGAGDEIPGALRQIGCNVSLLAPADLAQSDLSRFAAIVTGVRAYNTRSDLEANQHRLLDYVHRGGTLVVQYNVLERGGELGNLGPYPFRIGRDRITVEDAPIEVLRSAHPLLETPNRITAADFEGWVQERGLYFPSEWDPKYETVLASHDPGEKPLAGGLLYARYGKGAYVFTAYSWFRQLPAGVPGAYRLFANLLSAGRAQ
jgi:LmbE family N-acetylglucosaminyl deacetylase